MQDIYAFDVGDYGKLGLLRQLTKGTNLTLGVLWYKTTAGTSGADGKHVTYLSDDRYSAPDPELWRAMGERFRTGERRIERLEPLLPAETLFHREPVPPNGLRDAWFQKAATVVQNADLVFCDPDNGVHARHRRRSVRHIALAEVRSLAKRGHSLVLYHHLDRSEQHAAQVTRMLTTFDRELSTFGLAFGAQFKRGSSRVFFVLAQPKHADSIRAAMKRMEGSPWVRDGHFAIIPRSENYDSVGSPLPLVTLNNVCSLPDQLPPDDGTARVDTSAGQPVSIVLNDNGGLNLAANPWLRDVSAPCEVRMGPVSFTVVGPFAGRVDMFRVRPSTLSVARSLEFGGDHLSKTASVRLDGTLLTKIT